MGSEAGLAETLSRLADKVGRLLVQHVQLVRSELEGEARGVAKQGRAIGAATLRAAPFLIAGAVLISLAAAQLLGVLIEPGLGRFALPVALLLVGSLEFVVAAMWLRRVLAAVRSSETERRVELAATAPERTIGAVDLNGRGRDPHIFAATAVVMEAKPHGSMG